jgi:F-type H+-transporting ATPase subunit b
MLNIDLATIIFQVINFVVLAVLLNRILFQPMLRNAAQRKAEQERLVQELAAERQNAIALRDEQEQWQSRVQEEALRVTKEEGARAEAEREGLLVQAQAEAERVLVEAQSDAQRLTQQALAEFHDGLVDTVLLVSGSVIDRVSPPEVHDALVSGLVERIQELGRSEMRRIESIRQSLGEREPTAFVTSARELSTAQQGQLAQILTSLADRRVNFEIKTDSQLVAGVRVRLGDTLIDNSIEGRLKELREQVLSALKEHVNDATS